MFSDYVYILLGNALPENACPSDTDSDPFASSGSSYTPSNQTSESDSEATSDIPRRQRKRKANRALWKRSLVKSLRLSGQNYINRSGKTVPQKSPKIADCSKCRYKCNSLFPLDIRKIICKEYYQLADYSRQKMYLSSLMENVPVSRKKCSPLTKNRKTSRIYYLKDTKGARHRVCQKFFCATFAISHRVVETCVKSMSDTGVFIGHDKRIHSKPPNATSAEVKQQVKKHIDLFPRIESHYCRRDSKKEYLSPELNISVMYRLYIEFCEANNLSPVSRFVYQAIFHEYDPPLSFYKPKKDQCSVCNVFKASQNKESLRVDYENHKRREKESLLMKEKDKTQATENHGTEFRAITFDLQAILPIPFAGDSQVYYKSHLNVYNFTIYDSSTKDGISYIWDETHGSKGSSEVGTCLFKYLQSLPATVEHIATFSDTCGGQNRNKFVSAAMLYSVNKLPNLKTIDLKFMESGHSYLEADSMHATIERARRHKKFTIHVNGVY
nr:unnamed protein product [Callosobruchus chinensis]